MDQGPAVLDLSPGNSVVTSRRAGQMNGALGERQWSWGIWFSFLYYKSFSCLINKSQPSRGKPSKVGRSSPLPPSLSQRRSATDGEHARPFLHVREHVPCTCSWLSFLRDPYFLRPAPRFAGSTWQHAEDICLCQCTWIYLCLCNHDLTVQGMGEL